MMKTWEQSVRGEGAAPVTRLRGDTQSKDWWTEFHMFGISSGNPSVIVAG